MGKFFVDLSANQEKYFDKFEHMQSMVIPLDNRMDSIEKSLTKLYTLDLKAIEETLANIKYLIVDGLGMQLEQTQIKRNVLAADHNLMIQDFNRLKEDMTATYESLNEELKQLKQESPSKFGLSITEVILVAMISMLFGS